MAKARPNWEKKMATQRRTGVTVSALALLAFALSVRGCGTTFETKQAACRRVLNHLEKCLIAASGTGFAVSVSELCEGPIEPPARDMSAVADCITSLSCAQLSGDQETDLESTPECAALLESVGEVGKT